MKRSEIYNCESCVWDIKSVCQKCAEYDHCTRCACLEEVEDGETECPYYREVKNETSYC